jgi:hypothetical protein
VSTVDASDRTPHYPGETQEIALMDDRYVLKLVFDGHKYAYFQYIAEFGTLCSGMGFLRIMLSDP